MKPDVSIDQALRRSHCSHDDRGKENHRCIGVCKITPKGTELSCELCGDDKVPMVNFPDEVFRFARRVLGAAGLPFDNLSEDVQGSVLRAVAEDLCPRCFKKRPWSFSSIAWSCPCGFTWTYDSGWRRPAA